MNDSKVALAMESDLTWSFSHCGVALGPKQRYRNVCPRAAVGAKQT
jgi:hypothetical protein